MKHKLITHENCCEDYHCFRTHQSVHPAKCRDNGFECPYCGEMEAGFRQ